MAARLSIVIVAYRSRDEIGACLASLPRTLAGGGVEILVVDNSPGDGADEIVQRDFPGVRYLAPGENLGFGRANNLGFTQSSGECVLFLNPDTISNAGALEHCVRRLQAESDLGLISPRLVQADGAMDLACRRSIPTLWDGFCRATGLAAAFPRTALFAGYNLTHLPADGTYDVGAINGAFMMARREVLEKVAAGSFKQTDLPAGAEHAEAALPNVINPRSFWRADLRVGRAAADSDQSISQEHAERAEKGAKNSVSSATSDEKSQRTQVFDERFFMYGDDLDLCIRVARAGYRIVYDGRVQITHLKGLSVARDYDRMARAIFDANRDVYLKHFNPRGSRCIVVKYRLAFGLWKIVALWRARLAGSRRVRPQ